MNCEATSDRAAFLSQVKHHVDAAVTAADGYLKKDVPAEALTLFCDQLRMAMADLYASKAPVSLKVPA